MPLLASFRNALPGLPFGNVEIIIYSMPTHETINYGEQASKMPCGPSGAKPAGSSAFIGVSILLDTEALAGFAMPARTSAFNCV